MGDTDVELARSKGLLIVWHGPCPTWSLGLPLRLPWTREKDPSPTLTPLRHTHTYHTERRDRESISDTFLSSFSQRHCDRNRTICRHKSRGRVEVGRVALCIATTGNLISGDVLSTEETRIGGSFEGCCLFHWKAKHLHLQGCVWGFVQ